MVKYKTILLSLLITITFSLLVGFGVSSFLGFAQGAVLAFVIQVVGFYIYNNNKILDIDKVREEQDIIVTEIIQKSVLSVPCPCGHINGTSPIFEIQDTSFSCEKCNSKFRIEVVVNPVLLTEPSNLENAFNVIKNKELS